MKTNRITRLLSIIFIISMSGCAKKERTIYFANTESQGKNTLLCNTVQLNWDVHVVAEGVDLGTIEEGQTSQAVVIKGSSLEITTFEPIKDCFDKAVYYQCSGAKVCDSNDDEKAGKFIKKYSIPLNKDEYTINIGYGSLDFED